MPSDVDKRMAVLEERIEGMKNALALAHAEYERRLAEMNRFREERDMDTTTYPTRREWELGQESVLRRMAFLEKTIWVGLGALAVLAFAAKLIWK